MISGPILVLVTVSLSACLADMNVTDYIYWRKADINGWHQFFPLRALEEERQTNQAAEDAVYSLMSTMNSSLASIVAFQEQELMTAQMMTKGTDAEGCVKGISDYMPRSIKDEVDEYKNCAADALSKLSRLNNTWTSVKSKYMTAYQRALTGIDACARTYPNKNSYDRLRSCVDSMYKNYFTAANVTQNAVFPSPSMSYFQDVVVGCASTSALAVAARGQTFLNMLFNCSALDPEIDPTSYADDLFQWKGFTDTLVSQINVAQTMNYDQVFDVEKKINKYYMIRKLALENYVIESRGLGFYSGQMYAFLSDYYNTVTAASVDNPADSSCANPARAILDSVVTSSANASSTCDQQIVSKTKQLLVDVLDRFVTLNNRMPSIGNVALLNCIAQGYIFAPNTIRDCYQLTYLQFSVVANEQQTFVDEDMAVLTSYESSFFNNKVIFPCGSSSRQKALLGGETALYNMQRCLYSSSGTSYSVTTPISISTTSTTAEPTTFRSVSYYD